MATTRDHVAAYDYESRRRVTSLVLGVDEAGRDPRRRLNRTLFGSLVIAVLVMAGFGIAGLLGGGGGPDLPESGAVLVKGSGDRYVVVNGVVHPALNLTSALLVGGGTVTEVRASALNGRPRGLPVGIPEAPDSLPERLATGPWTVCAVPSESTVVPAQVEVLIGLPPPEQGRLGPDAGVVADSGGASWLISRGRRYRLAGTTRTVLDLASARSMGVPVEILNTLPEGPEIAIPQVARGAAPGMRLPVQASVGDVLQTEVPGQPDRYWMVQPDGISPITPLTATLLVEGGGSRRFIADPGIQASVPQSRQRVPGERGWPREVPNPMDPARGQPLCVSTTPGAPPGDAAWATTVSLPPALPVSGGVVPVAGGDLPGVTTSVAIPPGTSALALATTSAGQDGGFNLVTESGQRFPITSADAVSRLHLDPAAAGRLPLPFVALLPSGPALDPAAAAREYTGSAPPDESPNPGGGR